MWEAHIEE
jgi:hypothetical protein